MTGWRLRGVLALMLFTLVVAGYYVFHKPVGAAFFRAFGGVLLQLVTAALLTLAAGGVGARLWPEAHAAPLGAAVVQAALGFGILGTGLVLPGVLGLYRRVVFALLLVALLVLLRAHVLGWLARLGRGLRRLRPATAFDWALAAPVLVLLGAALVQALAPPFKFDALVYHLSLPQAFLREGRLVFTPENPYWGLPLLVEMLYLWSMGIAGLAGAGTLGWCLGALALLGTWDLASRLAPRGAWAAVGALLAGETLWSSLGWAYADWPAALFVAAALLALERAGWRPAPGRALAVGLLCGFALAAKMTAGAALVGLALILLVWSGRGRFSTMALFLAGALLAFGLWPLRNFLVTGAALWPFWGEAAGITALHQAFYQGGAAPLSLKQASILPVLATIRGVEGAPGFSASLGPLLLGLMAGLLLLPRAMLRALSPFFIVFLAGWLLWAAAGMWSGLLAQTRLHFSLFPSWAVLAGAGFQGLSGTRLGRVRLARPTGALVLLALWLATGQAVGQQAQAGTLGVLVGALEPEAYLVRRLGGYPLAMARVRALPQGSRVWMLWEPRGLYCEPRCVVDARIDRWYVARRTLGGEQGILQTWRAQGATHLLVNVAGMAFIRSEDRRYSPEDWQALEAMLGRLQLVEAIGDGYRLYALGP